MLQDGDDEFARNVEVARILREAAEAIENGATDGHLHDYNGNMVGRFDFTSDD